MNIEDLDNFLASNNYADETRRTYRDVLTRMFARSQDLANMSASALLEILKQSGWGNARQCLALAAAQKYLRWKYGHQHPALTAKLKRIQGAPQRSLDKETALKLLASFDPFDRKGARDLAICSVLLDTGLREAEVCRLQLADVDLEHRVLQVIVKGGQWQAAVFSPETAAYIDRWLSFRQVADGKGFLFTHIQTGAGLRPKGLYSIVKMWGRRIGIQLSVHQFRRGFAVIGTLNGAPERILMEGGRWSDPKMIKHYTRTLRLEHVRPFLPVSSLFGKDPIAGS